MIHGVYYIMTPYRALKHQIKAFVPEVAQIQSTAAILKQIPNKSKVKTFWIHNFSSTYVRCIMRVEED